ICLARLFSTFYSYLAHRDLHSFPTRRSSDLGTYTFSTILFIPSGSGPATIRFESQEVVSPDLPTVFLHLDFMPDNRVRIDDDPRSEEHTSELQSLAYLVCRLLLEKKKIKIYK